MSFRTSSLFLVLCASMLLTGADWRQFRGNRSDGIADEPLPTSISGDTIDWQVDLPGRGLSTPIVIGDRVYVSCSSGFDQDRLHLMCFEAATGEKVWERQFWATGRTVSHGKMCNATPTPCSDGERIVASFSSNDVVCVDLDGNLQWFRGLTYDYPNATNSLGMSSSPIIVGGTVVIQVESDADSFAFGLDPATGLEKWRLDRPRRANWTSPIGLSGDHPAALLQSSAGIQAVNAETGETLWNYENGASTIPSSTIADNVVYAVSHGITALRPNAAGGEPEELWNSKRLSPSTPSPLIVGDMVVVIAGVKIATGARDTGKPLWELRVPGNYSSTPIASGDHLYLFNEDGRATVVKLGREEGTIVSDYDFGEKILCSPSASNGAIYVRSDAHLWRIAE